MLLDLREIKAIQEKLAPQGVAGPKGDKGDPGAAGAKGSKANKVKLDVTVKTEKPKVKIERDDAKKETKLTFYLDKNGNSQFDEATDEVLGTFVVKMAKPDLKETKGIQVLQVKMVLTERWYFSSYYIN